MVQGDAPGVALYVQVRDLRSSLDEARALGGSVVLEPFNPPGRKLTNAGRRKPGRSSHRAGALVRGRHIRACSRRRRPPSLWPQEHVQPRLALPTRTFASMSRRSSPLRRRLRGAALRGAREARCTSTAALTSLVRGLPMRDHVAAARGCRHFRRTTTCSIASWVRIGLARLAGHMFL